MEYDFVHSNSSSIGCVCGGTGETWKYFKNEVEMVVDQIYNYCPICHPNLAQPILPDEGQEEISYEEFNRLSRTKGWKVI